MLREAKRNNEAYRPHALNALGDFAELREDLNLLPDAIAIVEPIVEDLTAPDDDHMDIDSDNTTKPK